MNLQISYEIYFLNGNKIKRRINCTIGQEVSNLKRKIIQFQGIKNQQSFKLCNDQHGNQNKVTNLTKELKFKQERDKNFGSVVSVRSRKMSEQSMFQETSMIIEDNPYQNFIQTSPQIPPVVCGYVTFPNSLFFCFSSRKYLMLDSQCLNFYNNQGDRIPLRQVQSQSIQQIKSYKRKHFYCIRLFLKDQVINMKFINKDICKQWVGYLNKVLNFSHYLKQKEAFSKKESFQQYMDTILKQKKNLDSTHIVKLEDQEKTVIFSVHSSMPCQNSIKRCRKSILKLSSFPTSHKIDCGSFSTIYLCHYHNRPMALKQLPKQKLLSKGQMKYALTQLSVLTRSRPCPYIIPLYYAFQTHEYIYLALKYVPFGNLGRLMRKRLPEGQATQLLAELVCAVQFLHGQRILYRDLKPENVLLDADGHLWLTDFGLAKELDQQDDEAHSFLGTPLYLAPERFAGTGGNGIDYKSDVYAVGVIFFQMLHGYHPFQADNFSSVVYNIRNNDVEIDQGLSPLVKKFLEDTLQKNPAKRIAKMSQHLLFKSLDWKKIQNRSHPGIKMENLSSKSPVQIDYPIDIDYNEENFHDRKIVGWNFNFEQQN